MTFDICFFEAFAEEEHALVTLLPKHITAQFVSHTIQESGVKKPPAALISIRTQSRVPDEWLPHISGILSRTTGYDHLLPYISHVPCGYLPNYCTQSVAEQALLFIFSLARKLPQQLLHFQDFNRNNLTGIELRDKHVLIVGMGNIGYAIYTLTKALGMKPQGVDITRAHKNVAYTDIHTGIRDADFIISAMNLTSHNKGYFSYALLKQAKKGAFFINVARGEHASAVDLLQLMQEKHLGGIALDVYTDEPHVAALFRSKKKNHNQEFQALLALSHTENVILTPHNSFNTIEAVAEKTRQTVEQIIRFIQKKQFTWQLPNQPSL